MSKNKLRSLGFATAITLLAAMTQGVGATTFSNPASITINDNTTATPYPSTIDVSALTGTVTDVNVTISGLIHTFVDDIHILLVGPGGEKVILMEDVGGSDDGNGKSFTFDDAASSFLPDSGPLPASGSYKPTSFLSVGFPAPAPAGPYGLLLSAFNNVDPNGTWSLYVLDAAAIDSGSIAEGWSLDITTERTAVPEPASLMLLSLGVAGLAARGFKKQK